MGEIFLSRKMMIAIHNSKGSFSERWIAYCESVGINYKIVDCFKNSIINDVAECDSLMWHFHQNNPKAIIFAKQLLFSLEQSGLKVFPDFNTVWHFDDKVGQKYLLEAIEAPFVPSWIFYDRSEALKWTGIISYPKVFKLRGGAGSQNVKLIRNRVQAQKLINKAFRGGIKSYDPVSSIKERWRLFKLGKTNLLDLIKGVTRFIIPPRFAIIRGRERGYVYFQEYIANNDHDIRVVVIGDKAFAIKRMVRSDDFRASGSGNILYDKELFNDHTIRLSFELAKKLRTQCVAFDYLYNNNQSLLLEISYGFSPEGYDSCPGYWDQQLTWHAGKFNPYGWMVDLLVK